MTFPNPLVIATAHQTEMHNLASKMRDNAGCIRQLLVGRDVRRKSDGVEFEVKEVRMGISSHAMLYGKRIERRPRTKGNGRHVRIGLVGDVELAEVQP